MAKGGGSTTQTQTPDAATQAYTAQLRSAAQQAAGTQAPGLSPYTQSAGGYYNSVLPGANLGFSALTGDQSAMSQFMNPYQQNVIDAMNTQYGDMRKNTMSDVNDAATQAGAFGGSRHGVAEGVALGQVDKDQASQMAQLMQSGYNDASGRAATAANMGFGAASGLTGVGQQARDAAMDQNPDIWRLKMLQQGMGGPYGQTATTTQQTGSNPFSGALGGAAAGSAFGPWGAGVGGLLGLFS